jgi:hypothetical protein
MHLEIMVDAHRQGFCSISVTCSPSSPLPPNNPFKISNISSLDFWPRIYEIVCFGRLTFAPFPRLLASLSPLQPPSLVPWRACRRRIVQRRIRIDRASDSPRYQPPSLPSCPVSWDGVSLSDSGFLYAASKNRLKSPTSAAIRSQNFRIHSSLSLFSSLPPHPGPAAARLQSGKVTPFLSHSHVESWLHCWCSSSSNTAYFRGLHWTTMSGFLLSPHFEDGA